MKNFKSVNQSKFIPVNQSKFIPVWVPEFIFLSIEREARKTNKDPGHLITVAWCEHVQAQLRKKLADDFSRLGQKRKGLPK